MLKTWVGVVAMTLAGPAWAQTEPPRFCPNRPDIGASSCTVDPGRVLFEISGIDWQREDDGDVREDVLLVGDFQARIGLDPRTEVQIGWTPYGRSRVRDKSTGRVSTVDGAGDVRLGLRRNVRNPDGNGLSIAVEPFVRLPVGRDRLGAGDWGGGLVVPINYEVGPRVNLALTAEVDAAVDEDGNGHHAAYSAAVGVGYALTDRVGTVAELQIGRDDDPANGSTLALGALSLVFQPRAGLQFDMFAAAGLNRSSPDFRFLTGAAFLF